MYFWMTLLKKSEQYYYSRIIQGYVDHGKSGG